MQKTDTTKPNYGIDAPGLVKGFLFGGVALLSASWLIYSFVADTRPWGIWVALLVLLAAVYALGMFGYMLWSSLVAKVVGREAILDQVAWTGQEIVLDVGCGRGLMLVGAARRLTTGMAVGVDIWSGRDQSANEQAAPLENARLEGVGDRVSVQTADMRTLPFPDRSFDVVVSSWAVHNLDTQSDRAKMLAEMMRVVRPGGTVLLNDIVNRDEYLRQFKQLGAGNVRLVVGSAALDTFRSLISFGSFQPATVVAHRTLT